MDSTEFVPLRVRAWLRTPVVSDRWLPLDGVLLYQHTRQDMGGRDVSLPGGTLLAQPKGHAMRGGRLPLAYVHCKDWYYRCSWAQWGAYADGVDAWAKRFDMSHADLVDFAGKRGRIDTSASTYKAYRMPIYYRAADWVQWYCLGSLEGLKSLVSAITHLGKKATQGWGRVLRWEIENIEQDYSVWKEDKLMRGIPRYHWKRDLGVPVMGMYGIRPSYWDPRNQVEMVMP